MWAALFKAAGFRYVVPVAGTRVAFKTVFPAIDLVVGYVF